MLVYCRPVSRYLDHPRVLRSWEQTEFLVGHHLESGPRNADDFVSRAGAEVDSGLDICH